MSANKAKVSVIDQRKNDNHAYQEVFSAQITKNGFGSVYASPSPCFLKAVELVKQQTGSRTEKPRVLDIGCAFGFSTKILLENQFHVLANDLSSDHLDILSSNLSEHRDNLELKPGDFTEISGIPEASLDGIFALRVLHFMRGNDVRRAFQLFHRWLKPTGVLLVTCSTPFRSTFDERFWRKFKQDLKTGGVEWPGEICVRDYSTSDLYTRNVQERMNYFLPEILVREAKLADLDVFESGFENRPSSSSSSDPHSTMTKEYSYLIAVRDVFERI